MKAARAAFDAYSNTSVADRLALLERIVARLQTREAELADTITRELGAPRNNKGMTQAPSNPMAPMGGYKRSGNGREMGPLGLEEYLEVKAMFGYLPAQPA